MWFFWSQAMIIMLEDHIIQLGRALYFKESGFWRFIGFLYTITWFSYSMRGWYGVQTEQGLWLNPEPTDWLQLGRWLH